MQQAIETKYHPATSHKSAYYTAECRRGKTRMDELTDVDVDENHRIAAVTLIMQFCDEDKRSLNIPIPMNQWIKDRAMGTLKNGNVVHVYF